MPATPHRDLAEWLVDEHALSSGLVVEVNDPIYGRMKQPGPVSWIRESADAMLAPTPRQWVSFDEALSAFDHRRPNKAIVEAAPKGWLEGIRILDLCNVIAGPHTAYYLARYGAEVIKLDAPTPQFDPAFTVIYGFNNMRGKRSILVNLKTPDGRAAFEELVKSVDVIVWNATDRQISSLGLDESNLQLLNPRAIFCQLDAYSGIKRGPRSDYLGYDNLVQAATGITMRFSNAPDEPEDHAASAGTLDVNGGLGAALAIGVALYQREKTGIAVRAQTSLAALSGLLQVPFFYDFEGREPFNEPSGTAAKGFDPLRMIYQTADGKHVMIHATEQDVPSLFALTGQPKVDAGSSGDLENFLSEKFREKTALEWIQEVHKLDIASSICDKISDIRAANSHPGNDASGSYSWSVYNEHPSGHSTIQVDPFAVRLNVSKLTSPTPAEKYGASTRAVLLEHGFTDDKIDEMLELRAIAESWSHEYLPS